MMMIEAVNRYAWDNLGMDAKEGGEYVHYDDYAAMQQLAVGYEAICQAKTASEAVQGATIAALNQQLVAARNEALEEAASIMAPVWGIGCAAAIRALASHPAAPVQPVEAVHQFRGQGCADWYDGHPDESDGGGPYEVRTLYRAAPPVQQTGDVRDLHAEIMNLPCTPVEAWGKIAVIQYKLGHRDARHAAAELVASVEHEALATTRPSAALTDERILEIQTEHVKEHCWSTNGITFARAILAASGGALAVPDALASGDVQWVVNDNAELGVKIGNQFFFLYKGRSLIYEDAMHDDGTAMHWRPVFKREFGECAHPINYNDLTKFGTVSLADSDAWQPLPAAPTTQDQGGGK